MVGLVMVNIQKDEKYTWYESLEQECKEAACMLYIFSVKEAEQCL